MLKRRHILPFLVIITLALCARFLPGARTIDDSFITYRYARNILAGEGFVYNPGERVQGTTTPLFTLLMVMLGALRGGTTADFPAIALAVNALADTATALLLWQIGKRLKHPYAGITAGLLWAIAPFSVTFAIGGLETSLYMLLLTATVYAHISDKHTRAAWLAALSLLTRPDALLLLALLAFDRAASIWKDNQQKTDDRRPAAGLILAELLAFGLPTAAWFGFATLYFGSPIPHSVAAKTLAYRLPDNAGLIRLMQHYATPFLGHLTFGIPWIAIGLIFFPFLFYVGARAALKENPRLWPWALYPWLYFAVFAIANPLIFRWYLTPPLPVYFLFILIGMEKLVRGTGNSDSARGRLPRWKQILLPMLMLLPLISSLRGWQLQPDHGPQRPAPEMAWFQLELLYRQAADWLNDEIQTRGEESIPTLAAGDVGVLGFYTPTRILDTVGLNSPVSLQYYPLDETYYAISYAVPPDLIIEQQPDYVILLEIYGRKGLFADPRFDNNYVLLHKIPTDIYGSDGMLIYAKRP
ncbi:MAG: hypothetical protein HN413_17445 [Chloroflexi bacterium]|jgi:arabinofuranosyltransferase|nr:hypothetical protein [Chloroflexota bacterium]